MDTCVEKGSVLSGVSSTCNSQVSQPSTTVTENASNVNGDLRKESTSPKRVEGDDTEQEDEFRSAAEFLKDTSSTSSPLENFKSSYAKSLADSYRRASLPVVVSAPRAQFYFNNDEVISLNSSYFGQNQNKCLSLNSDSSTGRSLQSCEPASLPNPLNGLHGSRQSQSPVDSHLSNTYERVRNPLEEIPVYVPYENISNLSDKVGIPSKCKNESITTADGKTLVMFSGIHELCKRGLVYAPRNGETHCNGSEKEIQAEGLRLEYTQLEGRVQQLCEVLADRDGTIQRLEEDLLRMRMECQRLMVENRSLKSPVSPVTPQPPVVDSTNELQRLKQHVELLSAQLEKAENSRRTYEAATRQLVDFLHTVNSTLTNMSSPHSPSFRNSSMNLQSDDNSSFDSSRRSSEAVQRAESVYALPTHTGNRPKVNRSVSTYCVASAPATKDSSAASGRVMNSEYLVTRAKELIASLKSLTRSESTLKLNVEPKKSGPSSFDDSSCGVTLKSFRQESCFLPQVSQITDENDSPGNGADAALQTQSAVKLSENSQPLSLMVVGGEASSHSMEHGYSSLPIDPTRFLNDSEQRLVWV